MELAGRTVVLVSCLLLPTGILYSAWSYKATVGVALAVGFALGWSNLVHVVDSESPANLIYNTALAMVFSHGYNGAQLSHLEP